MKCWKCGRDLADGADKCLFCGASMKRSLPATPAGKAMRTLYDRMGMQEVLSKKIYLTTALGDLMQDSQKLRNQLGMAMDSGMGSMYLTQLKTEGKPTSDFQAKVKHILTVDAGLSDKIALDLMGYMDEMIGWQAGAEAQKGTPSGNREQPRNPSGEQPRNPAGSQPQPQCAELEKLKSEAVKESDRILVLQQKLSPLKYIPALKKEATDLYDQLINLNRSMLDMMNNININLNLPSPNPDAVTYAKSALRVGRMGIEPLEKQANELFRKAETLNVSTQDTSAQNTAAQNTAAQNKAAPQKDSNNSGKGGCLRGLLAMLLLLSAPVGIGVVAVYGGPIGIIIVVILAILLALGVFGSVFKKK